MARVQSKRGLLVVGGSQGAGVMDGEEFLGQIERVDYAEQYFVVRVPFRCFKPRTEPEAGDK